MLDCKGGQDNSKSYFYFMHIFIDTNQLYHDPFFTDVHTAALLKVVKKGQADLYISEVVLAEIRKNFEITAPSIDNSLNREIGRFNKITKKKLPLINTTIADRLKEFDFFYDALFSHQHVHKLIPDSGILNEVYQWVLNYKSPFFEKKTKDDKKNEFKDAVIWFCIKKTLDEQSLNEAHLITANVHDFIGIDGNLHENLNTGSATVFLHKSIKEFWNQHKTSVINVGEKLPSDLSFLVSDYGTVNSILQRYLSLDMPVFDFVRNNVIYADVGMGIHLKLPQKVVPIKIELGGVTDVVADYFDGYVIATCFVPVRVTYRAFTNNEIYRNEEGGIYNSGNITLRCTASFQIDERLTPENIEIELEQPYMESMHNPKGKSQSENN
jgi:hypothetical protein